MLYTHHTQCNLCVQSAGALQFTPHLPPPAYLLSLLSIEPSSLNLSRPYLAHHAVAHSVYTPIYSHTATHFTTQHQNLTHFRKKCTALH